MPSSAACSEGCDPGREHQRQYGIALAFVAAARGYHLKLTMPERMSSERVALLRYLGADVVLTPGSLMREAVARANELEKEIPAPSSSASSRIPQTGGASPYTAIEIWDDTRGDVDVFVAGVGTGGTITEWGGTEAEEAGRSHRCRRARGRRGAVRRQAPSPHDPGIGAGFVRRS